MVNAVQQEEELYAHTPAKNGQWHSLCTHLTRVGEVSASFADAFGQRDLGYLIGCCHDLGKANPEFQGYLWACHKQESHAKVRHAIWGSAFLYKLLRSSERAWKTVALPVHGHHAGLPHGGTLAQDLLVFLESCRINEIVSPVFANVVKLKRLPKVESRGTQLELLIRMLFSALVDADYLDTERHFQPENAAKRLPSGDMSRLWPAFERKQKELTENARRKGGKVNEVRTEVYNACLKAAPEAQGIYRLTVPTGGGKTRSVLGFALQHAIKNELNRIIVVIPFTSIIEQTADEYRKILGAETVLEHHSNIDEAKLSLEQRWRWKLAAENWDVPVIVTTSVQFFESLFTDRPREARKLHNIARSVVVLDEVQTLPANLLEPTLDALSTLVERYSVTLVLCSATQPAFEDTPYLPSFHKRLIREIVPQYREHFRNLTRVNYEMRAGQVSWGALALELTGSSPAQSKMVVLNSIRDALSVIAAIPEGTNYVHLSARLCGAHRRAVLRDVQARLEQRSAVLLVATQVVEAGVDISFDEVWRALGPLDRIIQAAGRCNREGDAPVPGRVVIFEPEDGHMPRGAYELAVNETRALLGEFPITPPDDAELLRLFYRRLFSIASVDKHKIQDLRAELNYPEVSRLYQVIEPSRVVVVDYGGSEEALRKWRNEPSRQAWRDLQPFMVSLREHEYQQAFAGGLIAQAKDGPAQWFGKYDNICGLLFSYNPERFVV